jgi:hypothetical protein
MENGITRHEFEAVLEPVQSDIREIKLLVGTAVSQMGALEKRMAYAQGAVAATAFMVGSGVLTMIALVVLQV